MADSATTIALRRQIAQVEAKIDALQTALSGLRGVKNNIKESYSGGDAGDLYGNKYDEMETAEQTAVKNLKSKFNDKQDTMVGHLNSQIFMLGLKRDSLNQSLAMSVANDAALASSKKQK